MKITIVGYGRMGREVFKVAEERGHECTTIDTNKSDADYNSISKESVGRSDVCIDFTHPDSAISNIEHMAALKKNIVVGTTGWYDRLSYVKELAEKSNIGFLWAPNFSIGVNLYFRMVEHASFLFSNMEEYDVMGYEIHHSGKADSPSGTAIKLSQILLENMKGKNRANFNKLDRKPEEDEIHFASVRGGSNPGLHTVIFDSPFDTVEISHQNRNRRGLAIGAVLAAEFVCGRKGFFEIEDLIKNIIGG
ncbi:MAG: 4-hydroxy-tetrahydrodipicolinate reductase [Candidatus Methanofastidiosia archaeon]